MRESRVPSKLEHNIASEIERRLEIPSPNIAAEFKKRISPRNPKAESRLELHQTSHRNSNVRHRIEIEHRIENRESH